MPLELNKKMDEKIVCKKCGRSYREPGWMERIIRLFRCNSAHSSSSGLGSEKNQFSSSESISYGIKVLRRRSTESDKFLRSYRLKTRKLSESLSQETLPEIHRIGKKVPISDVLNQTHGGKYVTMMDNNQHVCDNGNRIRPYKNLSNEINPNVLGMTNDVTTFTVYNQNMDYDKNGIETKRNQNNLYYARLNTDNEAINDNVILVNDNDKTIDLSVNPNMFYVNNEKILKHYDHNRLMGPMTVDGGHVVIEKSNKIKLSDDGDESNDIVGPLPNNYHHNQKYDIDHIKLNDEKSVTMKPIESIIRNGKWKLKLLLNITTLIFDLSPLIYLLFFIFILFFTFHFVFIIKK